MSDQPYSTFYLSGQNISKWLSFRGTYSTLSRRLFWLAGRERETEIFSTSVFLMEYDACNVCSRVGIKGTGDKNVSIMVAYEASVVTKQTVPGQSIFSLLTVDKVW